MIFLYFYLIFITKMINILIYMLLLTSVSALNPTDSEYMSVDELYKNILNEQECMISPHGIVECGLQDFINNNNIKFDEIIKKVDINNVFENMKQKKEYIPNNIDELVVKILIGQHIHFNFFNI
jgi:hypothetical protein